MYALNLFAQAYGVAGSWVVPITNTGVAVLKDILWMYGAGGLIALLIKLQVIPL